MEDDDIQFVGSSMTESTVIDLTWSPSPVKVDKRRSIEPVSLPTFEYLSDEDSIEFSMQASMDRNEAMALEVDTLSSQESLSKKEFEDDNQLFDISSQYDLTIHQEQNRVEQDLFPLTNLSESVQSTDPRPLKVLTKKKPSVEEVLEDLSIVLNSRFVERPIGVEVMNQLELSGMPVIVETHEYPFLITWKRLFRYEKLFQDHVLLFMSSDELLSMIHEVPTFNTLNQIQSKHPGLSISLCLYQMHTIIKTIPKKRLEAYLMELQLNYGIQRIQIIEGKENYRDMAAHIMRMTKSMAMLPYHNDGGPFENFGSNSVRFKKTGKDAKSTWMEMILAIRPINEEIAKAIVRVYPSAKDLYKVYFDPTVSETMKEELLSDIKVKELKKGWKMVGMDISKRIYEVMTNDEDN